MYDWVWFPLPLCCKDLSPFQDMHLTFVKWTSGDQKKFLFFDVLILSTWLLIQLSFLIKEPYFLAHVYHISFTYYNPRNVLELEGETTRTLSLFCIKLTIFRAVIVRLSICLSILFLSQLNKKFIVSFVMECTILYSLVISYWSYR